MARRPTNEAIEAALVQAMGNVSLAARTLQYSRSKLYDRLNRVPALLDTLSTCRETMLDNAESSLHRAVLAGEAWAVCFYLKCQAKQRGYVERSEVQMTARVSVTTTAEELTDDELATIARRRGRGAAAEEESAD
jgi:hypothetical protein